MPPGRASEAQAREEIDRLPQTAGRCAQDPEETHVPAGWGVALRESRHKVAFDGATTPPLTAVVCKLGKIVADPLRGLFDATVDSKPAIVEYQLVADLRHTAQAPLLEDGSIEALVRGEVLPHTPDPWINESATKIGCEASFTRDFDKPQQLRTLEEISVDILAIEKRPRRCRMAC